MNKIKIIIKDIATSPNTGEDDVFKKAEKLLKRSGLALAPEAFYVHRRSVDARKKNNIKLVYSVIAECMCSDDFDTDALASHGFSVCNDLPVAVDYGTKTLTERPIIVGMGPAGMFCALMLSYHGYKPIVIERGDDVDTRVQKKKDFYLTHKLDTESNIQFGAGGAGTFSDGKLVTRINDSICSYVLRSLYELGAPQEILTKAKPHVGTDILVDIVRNTDKKLKENGADVKYRTRLDDIIFDSEGNVRSVKLSDGSEVKCGVLVLCVGHSARDTYEMLAQKNVVLTPKPFSVGVRIEHRRESIDRALYGDESLSEILGPAEYNLSTNTKVRGVYTFCMCPGGEVVAATSEEGGVVVNGMSNFKRDGENSNCAVAVSVFEKDHGGTVESAIEFQRKLERTAYQAGGGDFRAPVTTVGDFMNKRSGTLPVSVKPTYMNGENIKLCNFSEFMPPFIYDAIANGLLDFDRKISGFAADDAVLTAFETRTSAPVRIMRNENRNALGHDNLFPCGEGAGYAGGITSAAVDGIKTAIEIMRRYAPVE